jgi:hypothetical protein
LKKRASEHKTTLSGSGLMSSPGAKALPALASGAGVAARRLRLHTPAIQQAGAGAKPQSADLELFLRFGPEYRPSRAAAGPQQDW